MIPIWDTPKPALLAAVTILEEGFGPWAQVSTKLPARNRPDRFVKVSRTGGGQSNPVTDRARILVECFGRTSADVENMCNTARAVLRNSQSTTVTPSGGPPMFIRSYGNESGPVDFPHPDILDYERWQFTAELWIATNR